MRMNTKYFIREHTNSKPHISNLGECGHEQEMEAEKEKAEGSNTETSDSDGMP